MIESVVEMLEQQVQCYRRLMKLADLQHLHVQQSRTDALLEVLEDRQIVVDRIADLERQVAPAKRDWATFLQQLDSDARPRAQTLLAETRSLLEQITLADRNDVLVLQQRKLSLGRQIQQTKAAGQIHRKYVEATPATAGGGALDIQQ
jgi:hypothetical protein